MNIPVSMDELLMPICKVFTSLAIREYAIYNQTEGLPHTRHGKKKPYADKDVKKRKFFCGNIK